MVYGLHIFPKPMTNKSGACNGFSQTRMFHSIEQLGYENLAAKIISSGSW